MTVIRELAFSLEGRKCNLKSLFIVHLFLVKFFHRAEVFRKCLVDHGCFLFELKKKTKKLLYFRYTQMYTKSVQQFPCMYFRSINLKVLSSLTVTLLFLKGNCLTRDLTWQFHLILSGFLQEIELFWQVIYL